MHNKLKPLSEAVNIYNYKIIILFTVVVSFINVIMIYSAYNRICVEWYVDLLGVVLLFYIYYKFIIIFHTLYRIRILITNIVFNTDSSIRINNIFTLISLITLQIPRMRKYIKDLK